MFIQEFERKAFHQALVIKEGADFPFTDLQIMIRDLEMYSFGEYIHEEELRIIVEEGFGRVFLAFDGTQHPHQLVSYQVILFKEYGDKDGEIEHRLQPVLEQRRQTDNLVMHDDVHFDETTTIYFHLIGTRLGFEGLGISSRLKKEAIHRLTPEQKNKIKKVCIRINNAASLLVNMKVLGVLPTGFKPIDRSMIGSRETNFNLETIPSVLPMLDAVMVKEFLDQGIIQLVTNDEKPIKNKLLIPFKVGDQSDLADGILESRLRKIMDSGYQIKGVFKASDLNQAGDSFFYAEMD